MVEHWSEKPGVDSSILSLGISFCLFYPSFLLGGSSPLERHCFGFFFLIYFAYVQNISKKHLLEEKPRCGAYKRFYAGGTFGSSVDYWYFGFYSVGRISKAVWKSRAAELLTRVQAMQKAQNIYFMANGVYAKKFADLDIKLPVKTRTSTTNCNLSATDTTFYGDIQSSLVSPDVGGSSLVFNLLVWRV